MSVRPISRPNVVYIRFVTRIATAVLLFIPCSVQAINFADKIVYVSNLGVTPEMFLVEGLDGNPTQLTRNMFVSSPTISPDGAEVAFVSNPPGGHSGIFKLHVATDRVEKLTGNAGWDARFTDLDWSPDGQQILFITSMGAQTGDQTYLSVMNMNSHDIRHILQPDLPTRISNPSWAPDSRHIIFSQEDEGLFHDRLFISDDKGNKVVEVRQEELEFLTGASSVHVNTIPAWSPSQHEIAYLTLVEINRTAPNPLQIYSMNLADGSATALTSAQTMSSIPLAWNPNGQKFLFAALPFDQEAESSDIYVMDANGKNMANLTQSPEHEGTAHWSPDGSEVVYARLTEECNSAVFVMDENGRNPQQLTFEPGLNAAPFWSPDGEKIVFLSERDGVRQIYTMDRDGNNVQKITDIQREFVGAPAWSPNGKWIAYGSGDKDSWGLYRIGPEGRNESVIYESELGEMYCLGLFRPAWSPDSEELIYVDVQGDTSVGFIKVNIDGGIPKQLNIEGLNHLYSAVWSPDGDSLLFGAQRNEDGPFFADQMPALYLSNPHTSEQREIFLWGIDHLDFKSEWNFRRLVWAPDRSQLLLSIERKRVGTQHEMRLYLIDTVNGTASLWMKDAGEADWVRPGFVYAVNPSGKRISTWAELKKTSKH